MNIVFMGTPDFAVPTLNALINDKHNILGVFTQPDKKKGRGHHITAPPVKDVALKHNIPVFQPATLKTADSFKLIQSLSPELIVVVAYGKILPKCILDLPPYGCMNVHASLLPKYRGAAPIQWSVLNGDTTTGVTTMLMAEGIDTGDMLLKASTPIGENETASELHDRLSLLGAELAVKTIHILDHITPIKQDDNLATHAPMLGTAQSEIDFTKPASLVHHHICGLSEWPCACFYINEKRLKVYKSEVVTGYDKALPKELLSQKEFIVGCGENTAIKLVLVQYEGSKKMDGADYLRGQRLIKGQIL